MKANNHQRAVAMRLAGASYAQIGDTLGLDSEVVESMVANHLASLNCESGQVKAELDLARLDGLLTGVWRSATKGDNTAVGHALKIIGQRADILARLDSNTPAPEHAKIGDIISNVKNQNNQESEA